MYETGTWRAKTALYVFIGKLFVHSAQHLAGQDPYLSLRCFQFYMNFSYLTNIITNIDAVIPQ